MRILTARLSALAVRKNDLHHKNLNVNRWWGDYFWLQNIVFFKSCLNIPLESGLGGHVVSFNFYDLWPPARGGQRSMVKDHTFALFNFGTLPLVY